ncbi:MAG: PHP domain-containing protein, partial [Candidatus Muiribacteriota bacterium]
MKKNNTEYCLFYEAEEKAEIIEHYFNNSNNIKKYFRCGSLRRKKEIVRNCNYVLVINSFDEFIELIKQIPNFKKIITKKNEKVCFVLNDNFQFDINICEEKEFFYKILYFTGSYEHNESLRKIAEKNGFEMNEHGLKKDNKFFSFNSENEIYKLLNMEYIEPELRENMGEIEVSLNKNLPELIEKDDLKGVFHIHTTSSDGELSFEQIEKKCIEKNYEYAGISDHSVSSFYANGLDETRLLKQIDEINEYNKKSKIYFLCGVECDIRTDGSLDYDDNILKKLDFVIASVHQSFKLSEDEMTDRIVKALSNPYVTMLGHSTGRLLLKRNPYNVNLYKVIEKAAEFNKAIEINSNPYRLDIDWRYLKYAKSLGVKLFINPDAHYEKDFDNIKFGVNIARKGWLGKKDVINTMNLNEIINFLKISRGNI